MKFSTPYELFEKAVSTVNASPNTENEISLYILIEANRETIKLTRSDLDVNIISSTKAKIEKAGKILVHGENLSKILKTYKNIKKSDDCYVTIESESGKVMVSFSDNTKYKPAVLSTRDPEEFMPVDEFKNEIATCDVLAAQLKDYFTKSLVALNKHESNHQNAGVFFKFLDKKIELVSSNRQEVALIQDTPLSIEFHSGTKNAFALIPRKTLDIAGKIIRGAGPIRVSIATDQVRIDGDIEGVEFSVITSIYEVEEALDGAAMVPKEAKTVLVIPTAGLKNALTHMEAIMVKSIPHRITILPEGDDITISCKSQTGEIPGLPIDGKVERSPETPNPLILNDQRLTTLLKAIRSHSIRISYDQTGKACTFQGEEEPYFTLIAGTLSEKPGEVVKDKPDVDVKTSTETALEEIEEFEFE